MFEELKLAHSLEPFIPEPTWAEFGRIVCRCEKNGIQLGYLNWIIKDHTIEIADIFVHHTKLRQQGIGSMLIDKLKQLAQKNGYSTIWGITQKDDYPVHDFYRKHGFEFREDMSKEAEFSITLCS